MQISCFSCNSIPHSDLQNKERELPGTLGDLRTERSRRRGVSLHECACSPSDGHQLLTAQGCSQQLKHIQRHDPCLKQQGVLNNKPRGSSQDFNETIFAVKSVWLQVFRDRQKRLAVVWEGEQDGTGRCSPQPALTGPAQPAAGWQLLLPPQRAAEWRVLPGACEKHAASLHTAYFLYSILFFPPSDFAFQHRRSGLALCLVQLP